MSTDILVVADAYPLPDVADIVQEVGKAKYISTFDATKGYYQTAVREADRWLTAFICEFGLFEFLPVFVSSRNAPERRSGSFFDDRNGRTPFRSVSV